MTEHRVQQIVPVAEGVRSAGDANGQSSIRLKVTADDDADWVMPGVPKHYFLPRVFSLALLGLVAYGLIEAGRAGYLLYTDALGAPLVL